MLKVIIYKSNNNKMNADVSIPALSFIPHIQPLLNGDIAFDEINMLKPVITLSVDNKKVIEQKKEADLPKISISSIRIKGSVRALGALGEESNGIVHGHVLLPRIGWPLQSSQLIDRLSIQMQWFA